MTKFLGAEQIKREDEILYHAKKRKPLPLESKKDHVKQIFATLNFKPRPSSYTEDFGKIIINICLEYTEEKKKETLNPDNYYHYTKSFEKTFEQEKLKHKIIIRK